jgi:maltooligosyltrehalose trehalohydrolase
MGPHGASEVVDPEAFAWTDAAWPGLTREGLVLYELHVGTFTPQGTFDGVIERLPYLRELGVTAIELMPVATFPGARGWGYDGVDLFAPIQGYGGPEGLRRLVDAAHGLGLGVLLDVVYNHLGPDGNYLRTFSPDYFTERHQTPWGDALNFDGPNSHRVREFVVSNAWRWIREFHVDGLRLDAVHQIHDSSPWHILADLTARARAAAHPRGVVVIAESETNDVTLLRSPLEDGYGLDGVWADDFHHVVRVLLTGEREGYYAAYQGLTHEIATAINEGFIYQGQHSPHTGAPRGTRVTDEPATAFVFCIENHDQVGNRALGERLNALVSPAAYRVASALLLLVPETPLLFMGQEFAASTPFLFFTDHESELGRRVTEGRRAEFAAFTAFADPEVREQIPDPQAAETFLRSKLDWSEVERNADTLALYRNLLALRREDPVLAVQDRATTLATAVSPSVVTVHRWGGAGHRLLLANFGGETDVALEDVLAPHAARDGWRLRWQSNARGYGGDGAEPPVTDGTVRVPSVTAALLARDD